MSIYDIWIGTEIGAGRTTWHVFDESDGKEQEIASGLTKSQAIAIRDSLRAGLQKPATAGTDDALVI